jgi:DamX protein
MAWERGMTKAAVPYVADHYVERLDLGADPLASDYRCDYFYGGAMRQELLDQLIHFGRFSEQVLVLVGSTGSGTSTLLHAMLSQLQQIMDSCRIDAEVMMSADQLLVSLAEQLRLGDVSTCAEFLSALNAGAAVDEDQEPVLIAVDQAHYLSLESYELLHDLQEYSDGLVHLVLAGEYQVEQLAKLAGFDSAKIKQLELEPLTADEIGDYVLGLLQSVGYAGELPLSSAQLKLLHQESGGNITELRQLLPEMLNADQYSSSEDLGFRIPVAHLVAIAILVVVLLLSFLFPGSDSSSDLQQPIHKVERAVEQIELPDPSLQHDTADATSEALAGVESASESIEEVAPLPNDKKTLNATKLNTQTVRVEEKLRPSTEPDSTEPKIAAVDNTAVAQPKPAPIAPQEKPAIKAAVSPTADLATIAKQSARVVKTIPAREERLLKLPATSYLLQLLGTVDERRVQDFVKEYVGRLPVTYYQSHRNGKPWFVALSGPYEDKAAALAAIKVLPASLQKQQPWPRTAESVQKDINAN